MNGETRKIVRLALIVGLAAGATACANPFKTAQVDPSSSIAAEAAAAAKAKAPRRKFSDIPALPNDVPTADQVRAAVVQQQRAGEALAAAVAPNTWELKDTDAYVNKARRDVKAPAFEAPTDADRADTAAFARAARGRASAPPSQP
ncbi:hypothetical protein [Caulobacter sp. RL271]|jgi:hypothetical protein|uniref:Lipoprotein n=1 Tax=Caulobacter segnis TaxID=88688 RepID=A0ABY5A255_9CAUL|nr:hypothetical protein [Caulobacter segnis]USQ98211.1 hypothetical protein MZV50_11990 [Caulobacter segnis]